MKDLLMLGGAKQLKDIVKSEKAGSATFLLSLVIFFVLRVLIVQWTYNTIAPRLIGNLNQDTRQFKPLTFNEALMFVLLISFLFML